MTENNTTPRVKTIDRIIESVGPYGLIAVCVGLAVNVLQKPLDSNTWVSVVIICSVIAISFFQDRSRMKQFHALEELRLQNEMEMEKHIRWIEGNRPLIESSSAQGRDRMAVSRAFLAVRSLIQEDIKSDTITDDITEYCEGLIKRLEEIERTSHFLR